MYAHTMLLAFQMKLRIHGYNNSVIDILSRCSRDWTDATKMLTRKYICLYIFYTYFPKYIYICVSKHFNLTNPRFRYTYIYMYTYIFKLLKRVNLTRVQEHWSQADSTYYHSPVYSSCLDASTDTALY